MTPAQVTNLPSLGAEQAAAYARRQGWDVVDIVSRQALSPRPAHVTLRYSVTVKRDGGEPQALQVVVEHRAEGAAGSPRVWAYPEDPCLPGLPAAAAGRALGDLPAQAELLRWRPGRRAVFRYRRDGSDIAYVKVLPPERAERMVAAAAVTQPAWSGLRVAAPCPTALPGVVASAPVPGRSLRDLMAAGGRLPAPEKVVSLTERLAALYGRHDLPRSPRGSVTAGRASRAAEVVTHLVPEVAADAGRVLAAVEAGLAGSPAAAGVVHGDLYENQIFVAADGSLGLIDLDDLGLGDPACDAACCLAHLLVLSGSGQVSRTIAGAYRRSLREAWLRRLDLSPADLAWREAFALLLLATGPFRVLRPDWPDRVRDRVSQAAALV